MPVEERGSVIKMLWKSINSDMKRRSNNNCSPEETPWSASSNPLSFEKEDNFPEVGFYRPLCNTLSMQLKYRKELIRKNNKKLFWDNDDYGRRYFPIENRHDPHDYGDEVFSQLLEVDDPLYNEESVKFKNVREGDFNGSSSILSMLKMKEKNTLQNSSMFAI